MNYFRVYPEKNNTIITSHKVNDPYERINTGQMTIMEMKCGKKYSELIFKFTIPDWVKERIQFENFKVNLKVFDAGAVYNQVMGERKLLISTFYEEFVEGNGFSFELNNAQIGFSNYNYKSDSELWIQKNNPNNLSLEYQLDNFNQDIELDVKDLINFDQDSVCFKINVLDNLITEKEQTKFIFSRQTRTIYKPHLEFIFEDSIKDKRYNCIKGENNQIYMIFDSEPNGVLNCKINDIDTIPTKKYDGCYFVTVSNSSDEFARLSWELNGERFHYEMIELKEKINFKPNNNLNFVSFYINNGNTNSNNNFRIGDVIKFNVESFIQGKQDMPDINYEFKIVSTNGFEMTPWVGCDNYMNSISFYLNTEYFFPEMDYEIFLRINQNGIIKTSNNTFKFKLYENNSRLKNLSANPYYTKDWFFSK